MGGRAHGLDLAGPLALDGVRLAAGAREQARPRAGDRVRACRSAGRSRRARRHSRPDAPDRQPRRDRPHGRGDHARPDRARRACRRRSRRRRCPRSWCCPTCGARSRRSARRSRSFPRTARRAIWCRSSIRPRRPSRIPAASSSSSRKAAATITAGRAENWRADYSAARAPSRRDPRRDRPARLELHHPPHRPSGERAAARAARAHRRGQCAAAPAAAGTGAEPGGRMIGGLPLGFAQPLVLLGLLSLPVLWWLLRLIPPRPRRIEFPPTRLLFDIVPKEDTPARTPWWLTLLRLTLAALVILAAAGPLWNPPLATSQAAAPLALLIDDGWAAAATWDARLRTADDIIARAESRQPRRRDHSARPRPAATSRSQTPGAARVRLRSAQAQAAHRRAQRGAARDRALRSPPRPTSRCCGSPTASISATARSSSTSSPRCCKARPSPWSKAASRPRTRWPPPTTRPARSPSRCCAPTPRDNDIGIVRALDPKGLPLGEAPFAFKGNERETDAEFDLPVEIRNDIARLEIAGERSAGVVQLLDKRWRRRTVGVITGSTADTAQPLLASTYLSRARAQPVRRRAPRRARLAVRGGAPIPGAEPADADPRRRRQRRRRAARAAGALGRRGRRAGALCRAAARRRPTTISFR